MIELLFALMTTSHAIEFLPCQRALTGSAYTTPDGEVVNLDGDQVVVRGPLDTFAEQGIGPRTEITDQETRQFLSGSIWDALHFLHDGDRVFVLDDADQVIARGYHSYHVVERTLTRRSHPALLVDPTDEVRAIYDRSYNELINKTHATAVAIVRISDHVLKDIESTLVHRLEQRKAHLQDPSRFIALGPGRTYERQIFETILGGEPSIDENGGFHLNDGGAWIKFEREDRIFLQDEKGATVEIEDPRRVSPSAVEMVQAGAKCIIIRRESKR